MISQRIKTLRSENNLTQSDLASILGIAKTTLAAYEQGKNEPSIDTLIKIADYFNISTDYLLGQTDVKSTDLEISYIAKYLGLNERSINELHQYNKIAQENSNVEQKLRTLNLFFTPGCELLEHITAYLNFAATHFKNFYDNTENSLTPISHLELWDDVEKISYSEDYDMWSKALLLIIEEELIQHRQKYLEERYRNIALTD